MRNFFAFSDTIEQASAAALENTRAQFQKIDAQTEYNQRRVLAAFIQNRVDEADFGTTTGYGYSDRGREKLDKLTADIFGAERAFIRAGALSCGTHTLSVCLFGVLRPGDVMLCVTGTPYDTLLSTIGIDGGKSAGKGTLKDFGVQYRQVELTENDTLDLAAIEREAARPEELGVVEEVVVCLLLHFLEHVVQRDVLQIERHLGAFLRIGIRRCQPKCQAQQPDY